MVTLSTKIMRDNIVNKSKNVLMGKYICINNDLTKLEMETEYEMRQEQNNSKNCKVMTNLICHFI